jgi:hypothetical protein
VEREFRAPFAGAGPLRASPGTEAASTCRWLYSSITMDAAGRIMPCCASPRPDIDLVFSKFDAMPPAEVFNSPKYRLARLSFADPQRYWRRRDSENPERGPHCANCTWPKDRPNVDSHVIRQYFRRAANHLFDSSTVSLLSSW